MSRFITIDGACRVAKVAIDSHGVYVKVNGYVYRPQASKFDRKHSKRVMVSVLGAGTEVRTLKIKATPFASVSVGEVEEWWCSHGPFLGIGGAVPTESLWFPIAINCTET
jgi:hypothetical protein